MAFFVALELAPIHQVLVPVVDLGHVKPLLINVNCVHLVMVEALVLSGPCSPPLDHAEAVEDPLEHLLLIQVDFEAAGMMVNDFILFFLQDVLQGAPGHLQLCCQVSHSAPLPQGYCQDLLSHLLSIIDLSHFTVAFLA